MQVVQVVPVVKCLVFLFVRFPEGGSQQWRSDSDSDRSTSYARGVPDLPTNNQPTPINTN